MELESEKAAITQYILNTFLPGESPETLTESTPLITGGVLDSIATIKLVSFLEDRFGVEFQAHEIDADHLDTIRSITALVRAKKGK